MKLHYETDNFNTQIEEALLKSLQDKKELVFICIGTDRVTGDCYGPLVGTFLKEAISKHNINNVFTYGTLHEPVHAKNVVEMSKMVKKKHSNATVIAIDCCLGKLRNVGMVEFKEGGIKPGQGVGKDLPPVGDYSIFAVVNVSGFMELFVLQSTRLSLVMDLARKTADSIESFLLKYQQNKIM